MENTDLTSPTKQRGEFDEEANISPGPSNYSQTDRPYTKRKLWNENELDQQLDLSRSRDLVNPEWETFDPTPDIFTMKNEFDDKFFDGKLRCVLLEWSANLYRSAGICYSKRNKMGVRTSIKIRLSEPILKYRTRKDLVETLLHEMIHAYCIVLDIREGEDGHGPFFKKMMHSINEAAGTNITVFHTYDNEVNVYNEILSKDHWWRCNGSCQNQCPFYGFVKRKTDSPPGPNDSWWIPHLRACGGTFIKMRDEPPVKNQPEKIENSTVHPTLDFAKYFGTNFKYEDSLAKSNLPFLSPSSTSSSTSSYYKDTSFNVENMSILSPRISSTITSLENDNISIPYPPETSNFDKDRLREMVNYIWANKFPNSTNDLTLNGSGFEVGEASNSAQITEVDTHATKKRRISPDASQVKTNNNIETCNNPSTVLNLSNHDEINDSNVASELF